MCINESTASGLQCRKHPSTVTQWNSRTRTNYYSNCFFFAYLKSITVSTIKKQTKEHSSQRNKGWKREQPYQACLTLYFWMLLQSDKAEGDRTISVRRKMKQQLYGERYEGILRNSIGSSCYIGCSKLLLPEDKRHCIINPLCQCYTDSQRQDSRQGQGFRAASTARPSTFWQLPLPASAKHGSLEALEEHQVFLPVLSSLLSTCGIYIYIIELPHLRKVSWSRRGITKQVHQWSQI